jgi:hypothetical protein
VSAAREIISALVAGGMDAIDAASLVARAAVEMTAGPGKSSNAERQQRYRDRNKAVTNRNETVTERNADIVTQTVTNRNETVTNNATAVSPIDTIIKNSKRQNSDRPSRGTRIDPGWVPSIDDRRLARQEGFSEREIDREALRFRDYWTGKAGSGGVKLDWASTWRNWIRTSADRLGKVSQSTGPASEAPGFYAKFGSEEQDAWDRYGQVKSGKSFPRDRDGGWRHPTQWPPGYQPMEKAEPVPIPRLRSA